MSGIGPLFHIIHLTDDLDAAETWYTNVLRPQPFLKRHYLAAEKRHATLLAFADVVVEPLAPAVEVEGWQSTAIGRYFVRTGPHWHSVGWYAEDPAAIAARCQAAGVRAVATEDSATVFTHPRDTGTQLQFTRLAGSRYEALDPRLAAGWDAAWWTEHHPLGLRGLGYLIVAVPDAEAAARTWAAALGAVRLGVSTSQLSGERYVWVRLGAVVVALGRAADGPADDGLHAVALQVADLGRAAAHLASCGVRVSSIDDTTLLTDPGTTGGATFRWTTDVRPWARHR